MTVAELMHRDLKTIATDATVSEAVAVLTAADVSALPVIDRFGRAVGVVSTREVLRAETRCQTAGDHQRLFERTLVLEIMAPWPGVVPPTATVQEAARRMRAEGVQRVFVEDHGSLVGVLSQTDIVAAVAAATL